MRNSIQVVLVGLLWISALPAAAVDVSTTALATEKLQEDFPAMCLDADSAPWVAYVEYDGKADTLRLARKTDAGLKAVGALAGPGVIHQPALARDGKGGLWAIWSQLDDQCAWSLKARHIVAGKIGAKAVTIEGESGSAVFADAATDRAGRVWVAWQSFRKALGDIFTKYYDPTAGKWSEEIRVTTHPAGDWEPRLAFGKDDGAWIAFDSSRGGNFNVYLAKVGLDGKTKRVQLSKSPRYEARAAVAAAPDGKGLWVAWENGRLAWGKNTRGVGGAVGLNAQKRVDVVYFDIASGKTRPAANATPVLKAAGAPAAKAPKKQPAKAAKRPKRRAPRSQAVNLPQLVVDAGGNPWLTCRFYRGTHWKIALTKYDAATQAWSRATVLPDSSFGQDRRCSGACDANGELWLAWPSDRRTSKKALVSGVYLAAIDTDQAVTVAAGAAARKAPAKAAPVARWGDDTPERPRGDRHVWSVNGKKYSLYWGDFHRHTDVSNCRTPEDGCIVEQFRYAYDVAVLDFLGTSDHTDVGKPYDPYEWWCNQKLADVFLTPGLFHSFYVYEREQRWPWGHRNVIFIQRGGPIIYIKRALYRSMPWQAVLPVGDGPAEISPQELWKLLRKNSMDVTIISHTGATGMGTDWDKYKQIDNAVENLVEIYQGARVSYEGINTPQPTVGFPKGRKPKADAHGSVKVGRDFGRYNKGVYQNALTNGYKLGVFANSDHISTHTTFGGAYAESFTRKGILDALSARRTIAATDKIFVEMTCNGRLLGEIFDTKDKPAIKIAVRGTAALRAVTIVRNEKDLKRFTPQKTPDLDATYTDAAPLAGENRYYLRVEQVDGNMAWTSPVWVTYER